MYRLGEAAPEINTVVVVQRIYKSSKVNDVDDKYTNSIHRGRWRNFLNPPSLVHQINYKARVRLKFEQSLLWNVFAYY